MIDQFRVFQCSRQLLTLPWASHLVIVAKLEMSLDDPKSSAGRGLMSLAGPTMGVTWVWCGAYHPTRASKNVLITGTGNYLRTSYTAQLFIPYTPCGEKEQMMLPFKGGE